MNKEAREKFLKKLCSKLSKDEIIDTLSEMVDNGDITKSEMFDCINSLSDVKNSNQQVQPFSSTSTRKNESASDYSCRPMGGSTIPHLPFC